MKTKLTTIVVFLLFIAAQMYAQDGGQPNFHSGNKLRVVFSNTGTIGGTAEINAEWPIGTGHEYLDVAFPVIAVESNGSRQTPNFTPLSSFTAAADGSVAMNYLKETWPGSWPDRPADWSGSWNGFFGKGRLTADQESLFALEDAAMGLRLTVRGWQWSHYLAQDMIFLNYELTNTGTTTYDRVAVGFFTHPTPGGDGDDDQLVFDRALARVTAVDGDNRGKGSGVAKDIGEWSPVGRISVEMLETPGNATDGIDNDGDGMIDESRSDGIDNDGDWLAFSDFDSSGTREANEPLNDDLGADGLPDTGDDGEGDGLPTPGEPDFDATDPDESDQIGLTSFAALPAGGFSASNSAQVWDALAVDRFDAPGNAPAFVLGSGDISLAAGETQRFSVVIYLSANALDQQRNAAVVRKIIQNNYAFPVAPPPPKVTAVPQSNQVTLYWDTRAEETEDFEGYKIFRSTDPGFNDAFTVTDDRGVLIYSEPIVTIDKFDDVSGLFPLNANGFQYFLGKNLGLTNSFRDRTVLNGKTYYYAVVAFDHGDTAREIFPTESTKSIIVESSGKIITDVNTVIVTPVEEASGFEEPVFNFEKISGGATGSVSIDVIDRRRARDAQFKLTFDDSSFSSTTYTLTDVTDPQNPLPVIENSTNYSTTEEQNANDPLFDGLRVFIVNDELKWDSLNTQWTTGRSNFTIRLDKNDNLGTAIPQPLDYEVRFGEVGVDTAIFSTPIPVPFEVWNVTDNVKENILVLDQNADGLWSSGEPIFIVEGDNIQNFRPVYWAITIAVPDDDRITPVPPVSGDVAFLPTRKPFSSRDVVIINSTAAKIAENLQASVLDDIKVVPNPYIVSSTFEQLGMFSGGTKVNKLQFTHLPQQCTIRIFNLRGVLLDVIEHDSAIDNGSEFWDLRPRANDKLVAFGMYIYHIDAPGIGEKIGRFGVIR